MRMLRVIVGLLVVTTGMFSIPDASAGPILDRIRSSGLVHCGGVSRPGLIEIDSAGHANGLELDLCRAVAAAVLGSNGRLEFRVYDSEKAYEAERSNPDDISFVTGREMIDNNLTGALIPGPAVFIETASVMVPGKSLFQHLEDLANRPVCFSLLQRAQDHLAGWFQNRNLDFIHMGFQEDVEMNDAYFVHFCQAIAGEATTLADTRATAKALAGDRFLPETLAAYPVIAATPLKDGDWTAVVAWTIDTLVQADTHETKWELGGLSSLRLRTEPLGLSAGWQKALVDSIGSYGDLYDRNLGEKSELKLPRGLNRPVALGGALVAPYSE